MPTLTLRHTLRGVAGGAGEGFDGDAVAVLNCALAGDEEAVAGTFRAVVKDRGAAGAYDVAWSLAARMVGDDRPRGPWRLDFPELADAAYDARWVAWFVSAYANEDSKTGAALVGAALADGRLSECLLTLAGSTVATLRRRQGD